MIITDCPFCNSDNTVSVLKMNLPTFHSACSQEELSEATEAGILVAADFEIKACTNCGLGFNAQRLPNEILDYIYSNYHYIKPQKKIGITKYESMVKFICKHAQKKQHIAEIGCSDGYLLDTLFSLGYRNIEGFEPSQEISLCNNKSLVRNEFFTENSVFKTKVDVFYLMHVLEHFSSPIEIMGIMQRNLTLGGKIIFEVPNYGGFYHQHLLFLNSDFIYLLAERIGMTVLETEETDSALRIVLLNENKQKETQKKISPKQILERAQKRISKYLEAIEKANEFIKNNRQNKIYWWGTGSTSTIILANVPGNILQTLDFTFIDSDETREGLVMPISSLKNNTIKNVNSEITKISKEDSLIIASSFSNEILKTLEEASITPKNILKVNL